MLHQIHNSPYTRTVGGKHKLLGSTFPEKIIFDGNKCRTTKMNEAVALILNIDRCVQGKKNGQDRKKKDLSIMVTSSGISSNFLEDLDNTIMY